MRLFLEILFVTALAGTVTSSIYSMLVMAAAFRFGARRRRELRTAPHFFPPISVLKPLHGMESGLEANLETFFQQEYPQFELLFCARYETDEGLQLARRIAARYPSVDARFLTCGEPQFPNPKMYSLAVLAEAAQFEYLVTSDADARVEAGYLTNCIRVLERTDITMASCLYIGDVEDGGFFMKLDALGKTVEMTAGVLVASMLSETDFALGVTMILRREAFLQGGGYEDLGQYWAEDFVLGNRIAKQGLGVEVSNHVIRLMVAAENPTASFFNQLRWMQSTRRSRPWGHLGTGLSFAVPFGLLGFAAEAMRGHWFYAASFLIVALGNRMLLAVAVLRALGAPGALEQTLLYPLRDLMGFIIWACSYVPTDTRYHGTQFRITQDGRLKRREAA